MNKKNIAVLFGSRSCEHEISIITAIQFMENMDTEKYNIVPVYITPEGEWYTGEVLMKYNTYKFFNENKPKLKNVILSANPKIKGLIVLKTGLFSKQEIIEIDIAVLSMHGMNGEDGTLQGLFELANIPYVSSGVLGSAIGMDKIAMKAVFKGNDLPILKYEWFLRNEWYDNKEEIIKKIESSLKYPMFVKPANLGSSIGITKAKNKEGLINGIEIAINYDKRIIVEEGIENLIEINCSGLGYDKYVEASVCEQPISWEEFLSFDDKYLHGINKSQSKEPSSMESMDRQIPANIPDILSEEIQDLTVKVFKALSCSGVARVDYLIDKNTMKPYVNEINTIPGCFSFYLWEYNNKLPYPKLIDKLLDIAIKVNEEKNKNDYSYQSKIIGNLGKGGKLGGCKTVNKQSK